MKKSILIILGALLLLISCKGGNLKDGTFKGYSTKDDNGGYGEVTITIKDGKFTEVDYITFMKNGDIKDENYGKQSGNDEFYKKAQIAVKAMSEYAKQLAEKQVLDEVEAVSGATVSYNQFLESVDDALAKADK